jgi:hypothetical protein
MRMQQLLRNRITPSLGGRNLIDGVARVVTRFDDGGVLLFAPAGVSTPREDKPPEIVKPAWITIRPGRAIELLEPVLTRDANPDKQHFFAFDNEWIVTDTVQGPRRLFGNHLEAMLPKEESAYVHIVGYDRRGRWLLKKSPSDSATLILDPTLPNTTPRLPAWLIAIDNGQTGWTKQDWPGIKRGGAWALHEAGWQPINPKNDELITRLPGALITSVVRDVGIQPIPPARPRPNRRAPDWPVATTTSTTRAVTALPATTRATTTISVARMPTHSPDNPILIDREGRRYFDGKQSIRIIDKSGKEIVWPLPPSAASDSTFTPVLIQSEDGTLYLFNERGRVVRIKPTPTEPQPFTVEAIFTRNIPASEDIRRIWLDPAGRIVIAYDATRLAILFPQGRIPPDIAKLMLATDDDGRP